MSAGDVQSDVHPVWAFEGDVHFRNWSKPICFWLLKRFLFFGRFGRLGWLTGRSAVDPVIKIVFFEILGADENWGVYLSCLTSCYTKDQMGRQGVHCPAAPDGLGTAIWTARRCVPHAEKKSEIWKPHLCVAREFGGVSGWWQKGDFTPSTTPPS